MERAPPLETIELFATGTITTQTSTARSQGSERIEPSVARKPVTTRHIVQIQPNNRSRYKGLPSRGSKVPPRPPVAPFRPKKTNGWRMEISGAIFSSLCIATICVILSKIDGRPLSVWSSALSPNAIISALSTVSRASMFLAVAESISQLKWLQISTKEYRLRSLQIFDDASRGPLGSLGFIWAARAAPFTAYVACLITILGSAFDPFAQQVLEFASKPTVIGANSSISYSLVYDNDLRGTAPNRPVLLRGPSRDLPMMTAIAGGIYDRPIAPPFECPGSNCTYPSFESIGVCSQCNDVTRDTNSNCVREGFWTYCDLKTPGNFTVSASSGGDARGFSHTPLNISILEAFRPNDITPELLKIALLRFPFDDFKAENNSDMRWLDTLEAHECLLSLCAVSYSNFTVQNGTIHEGTVRKSPMRYDSALAEPLRSFLATDDTFPGEGNFTLHLLDQRFMNERLETIFDISRYGGDPWSTALVSSPDIPTTMKNVATSMSYRMLAGPNATTVHGEVFAPRVFIQVHWEWMILPIALVVLACLLLANVIFVTHRAQVAAWKSSLTPLLFKTERNSPDFDETGAWSLDEEETRARIIASHVMRNPRRKQTNVPTGGRKKARRGFVPLIATRPQRESD